MPITMQGNWTVAVKSKNAGYRQRFIIQGSDAADGIYPGETSTPPVDVTGTQWSITIEHLPRGRGASWQVSDERLGTPSRSAGQIVFDIFSNDSGPDEDYNDLILTCSTAESPSDYVVYGKVRSYSGRCFYNPCFPYDLVIDIPEQLREALRYDPVRDALTALYPERIRAFEKRPPIPDPEPDPLAFRPMMIPLGTEPAAPSPNLGRMTKKGTTRSGRVSSARIPVLSKLQPHLPDLLKFKDRLRWRCQVEDQPGLLLRFIEYDRTASELGGGPYTGTGDRQILGLTVTDEQGNYIFRFTRTLEEIAEEFEDIPGGGTTATELRPDLIVQIVSGVGDGPDFLFETALLTNIPNLKRINLCVPEDAIHPRPTACQGGRAIQSIGNIWTLPGVGNSLDAAGRITATNSSGPKITRGAWRGRLDLFACFVDQPQVKYYTIRFRRPGGSWSFVSQSYKHIKISDIGSSPSYDGTSVGPFTAIPMKVDGGPPQTVPYYLNIELDPGWIIAKRTRKMQLNSAYYENLLYGPEENPRTVEFRIDGYDEGGDKVAGAEDSIRLYLDNRDITGDIESITMEGIPATECALFELPAANTILTVKFRVRQQGGFVQSYQLSVLRGSATPVAVHDVVAPIQPLIVDYDETLHGDTLFGTADAVNPDLDDYVTAELQATAGSWLPADKPFCAFAFEIHARPRMTNGYGLYGSRRLDVELVGISHPLSP